MVEKDSKKNTQIDLIKQGKVAQSLKVPTNKTSYQTCESRSVFIISKTSSPFLLIMKDITPLINTHDNSTLSLNIIQLKNTSSIPMESTIQLNTSMNHVSFEYPFECKQGLLTMQDSYP
jgi:hypothetical protein